ncbi:MAG: PSD1 and planctomycete cytochrome C domain-containing protein [Chloroherpetonaceae bacterium]|nr:PSD1 and planctomycete cytochrome C domain-containing protein [Chthonomonadaceae bacterium]MDW8208137.1 PSD1 and planctomycete cytochrome C domain-containing protein [Chloroherpetonaceae bacterium]
MAHRVAPCAILLFLMALARDPSMARQSPRTRVDFAQDILPIFRANCFSCHGDAQQQGGLRLDARSFLLRGGVSGPALFPGKSAKSLLLTRLTGQDGRPRMPLGFAPLSEKQIALIRRWIDQGASWSEGTTPRKHWAYIPPVRPPIPRVRNASWVRNPIDAFILARLEKEGLQPSPEADRITLIRRVTLDLIGLPPTPQEVDAFLADRSPSAYEKVVDRLLASPHYGERMALPWLDAARYADSNGFQQDGDTHQYIWRDWVVRALNANMPFDQFTIEQLAGDLLPNATDAQKIATGFNRCHMLNGEGGAIPEEQRHVILFDRVDVTATNWLGATMACAQCHDHKYDPITQKDYYRFMAFFNNVPESGVPPSGGQYRIAEPYLTVPTPEEAETLRQMETRVAEARARVEALAQAGGPALEEAKARLTALEKERDTFRANLPRVMIMSDARPRKTYILNRGNYEAPGEEVTPDTPAFLPPMPPGAPRNRLGLAQWLVSPDHPLTARVQVNRLWQLFFGRGLVKTSEDFGTQGERPTHPELLDWLAVEFRDGRNGRRWDMKHIVRLIVTSATYRQSSRMSPALRARDPENLLYARGARFRMSSLILRDVALASSGLLNPKIGGKPVYPYQPTGIWDGLAITKERDFTYPQSRGADLYRRSIYTFWRRTVAPANMFDASTRTTCKVRLSITSTPLHALTTLNDVTWVEAGRALAERVIREAGRDADSRLKEAFRRVCARRPDPQELEVLRRSLRRALTFYRVHRADAEAYLKVGESPRDIRIDPAEHAAYATVCLAIYNLDEALTRE